jgi:hypothetical protein
MLNQEKDNPRTLQRVDLSLKNCPFLGTDTMASQAIWGHLCLGKAQARQLCGVPVFCSSIIGSSSGYKANSRD